MKNNEVCPSRMRCLKVLPILEVGAARPMYI